MTPHIKASQGEAFIYQNPFTGFGCSPCGKGPGGQFSFKNFV